MLTFLHVAASQGFLVASYEDAATGTMGKTDKGIPWVATVTLDPKISYGGDKRPTPEESEKLHHLAHDYCFIANSVKTEVVVKAQNS